jgi:vitamin B12 transporter
MNHKLTGLWNYKISVTVNRVEGKSEDTFDMIDTTEKTGSSEGEYIHSEWQNNFTVSKHLQIIAGIEHSQESGQSCKCSRDPHRQSLNYLPHSSLSNRSAYIELMPNYRNIFFNFSGRIDNYKDWSVTQSWDTPKYFGSYRTWQAGMTFLVNSTKFKGNYGIGFKMPSLYQLFSLLYGNTDLTPETNHSWDVGGEHRFKDGVVEITYYNQHIANSIDLIDKYPNRGYTNRGIGSEWCTEGIEIYFLLYILKDLSTDISFTGLDKVNAPEDYLLLPSLDYRWGVTYKWLNVKFCCIGKRQDNDYTSDLPQLADVRSCSKINLTDSFKFKRIKIQIKIENLIDDRSMESAGYTAPGRGFCIGISY